MKRELKVGLLSFIAMALLLSMTFSVGKLNLFKKLGQEIPIAFNYVGNLKVNAYARISGVIIGKIKEIKLDDTRVIVVIQLTSPEMRVKRNSQVFISSEGLIGESYIDIKQIKDEAPFYKTDDPPLTGIDPVGVGEIMSDTKSLTTKLQQTLDLVVSEKSRTNLDTVMTNFASIALQLNELVKQNQALITSIVTNLNKMVVENQKDMRATSQNFSSLSGELNSMAVDSREKLKNILTNMESISQSLDKKTVGITDELMVLVKNMNGYSDENNKKISSLLTNMESISQKLNKMSDTFVTISQKIDNGTGTLGKLVNDPELYNNLNKTVEEAKKITPELTLTLTSLRSITDKIDKGEGTLGMMVQDKALYQNINELVADSRKVVSKVTELRTFWGYQLDYRFPNPKHGIKQDYKSSLIFKISPRPEKYYKLELNKVGETDKISVEVGQAFVNNRIILRAGIVEATGGVGANLLTFNNNLSTGLTAYNFNEKSKPFLRLTNEYSITEDASLTFGVDDMLNQERYYMGMKYMIEDKDVKYLLGLVSYSK